LSFDDLVRKGLISPQDLEDIRAGYGFLLQARCCLHFQTGRKDDTLAFHIQPEIARELGFVKEGKQEPVEIFLQPFYRHTKAINRIIEAFISRWEKPNRVNGRLSIVRKHPHFHGKTGILELKVRVGNPFRDNVPLMLEYFDIANRSGLAFGNHALLRLRQAVNAIGVPGVDFTRYIHKVLELCKREQRVGRMLRSMHDVGLLGLIIPDFNNIRFHTQHNMYHIYTTDEHIISVVRQLAYLKSKRDRYLKSIQEALSQIRDTDVLFLACFFHDIGKGKPGDHSKSSTRMLREYMKRAGFDDKYCDEASHLVIHHLAMNEIAQRRDLDDQNTILDFVAKIKFPSTLHKLYVLTYCDISSVHPDAWSGWKAALLRSLYYKALDVMKEPLLTREPKTDIKEVLKECASRNISKKEVESHLKGIQKQYLFSTMPEDIGTHIEMAKMLSNAEFTFRLEQHEVHYKLILAAHDYPRLLMVIAGCLASLNLSILSAKIFTRSDGIAIDEFNFAFPDPRGLSLSEIENKIGLYLTKYLPLTSEKMALIQNTIKLPKDKPKSGKSFHVPLGIDFSNSISENYSTIDISCQDQVGLMYLVTKVFSDLDINVHSAILTTEAKVAMDAFYVTELNNHKIQDENKIIMIKNMLGAELIG
jgi:[protein-PII] uridylyltransferase